MSSSWDINPSESATHSDFEDGSISNSPIYGLMDNTDNFDSNLGLDYSTSSLTNEAELFIESSHDTLDLTDDHWQADNNIEAEIANIHLFCEGVDNNLSSIGLGPVNNNVSTPRIGSPAQNIRVHTNNQPVEVIDLSNFEFNSYPTRGARARARTPDAIIDLCTPEATRPRPVLINLTEFNNTGPNRRRLNSSNNLVLDVDDAGGNHISPKRECPDPNDSGSDSYKCPVCLENVRKREPCSTKCGHIFCKACIDKATQSTRKCPLCNKKLDRRSIFRIYL